MSGQDEEFAVAGPGRASWRTLALRALLLGLLWWLFTRGDPVAWLIGIPTLLAALWASWVLLPPTSWSIAGLARFVPYFLRRSLEAGVDVALRALRPRPSLRPELLEYRFRLPPGPARVFMAGAITLLPGTLSAELSGDSVTVHVLAADPRRRRELAQLEERVGNIFGITLAARGEGAE